MSGLELRGVGHRFGGGEWLFRGLSFAMPTGAIVGLVGPSGTGKSTLLSILGGLAEPAEGEVVRGVGLPAAWVFQSPAGLQRRSVLDQLVIPLRAQGVDAVEAREVALGWLDRVGLRLKAGVVFRSLSGGEAQRVMFARSMCMGRRLVLLDEPTAALDRVTSDRVADVLCEMRSSDSLVVVCTHDAGLAARCDWVIDLSCVGCEER